MLGHVSGPVVLSVGSCVGSCVVSCVGSCFGSKMIVQFKKLQTWFVTADKNLSDSELNMIQVSEPGHTRD